MKKIFEYLKPYRKWLIIGPILKLIEAIIEVVLPIIIAGIIDNMSYYDTNTLILKAIYMLVFITIGLITAISSQYIATKTSQGYATSLRKKLFEHISNLSNIQIQKIGPSALTNRVTYDVNQLELATTMFIRLVIRVPFICISSLIMTFLINNKLGFIMLSSMILFSISIYLIIKFSSPLYKKSNEYLDKMLVHVKENLINARLVRTFVEKIKEQEKFKKINLKTGDYALKANTLSLFLSPITTIILNIGIVAVIYIGKFEIDNSVLSQGELIAVINYLLQMLIAILVLSNLIIIYTKAFVSARRIEEVLNEKPNIVSGNSNNFEKMSNVCIELKNVSFSYNNSSVKSLNDISFKIYTGEIIGIIGLTGSGKSTLLNILNRSYEVADGEVNIFNNDIKSYNIEFLKKEIKYISGRATLFNTTIKENVEMAEDKDEKQIKDALKNADALEFVEKKSDGINYILDNDANNLSGGQKQRILISRAFIANPRIFLLDDITSALDNKTENIVLNNLFEKVKEEKITTIITSQKIKTIREADKIIVLNNGKIESIGSHEELLNSSETYKKIYEIQN